MSSAIDHMCLLSEDLEELNNFKDCSDLTIIVADQKFHAHKNVLAARSMFFRGFLFAGYTESSQREVELKDASPKAFEVLLNYIYTGRVSLADKTKTGMFDRPNTNGFIHMSHYLLTIHNSERFKELVEWPIICKKNEVKFRNAIREFLTEIANENSDIAFPTILASHLLHAGGTKFTIIMWKLSQVVVRTFLKRETGQELMPMPKPGTTTALTKQIFKGAINAINNENAARLNRLTDLRETSAAAIQKERESLAAVKAEIFETEKRIAERADCAPVHPSIKKRLKDINDTEVIDMFKAHINETVEHVAESNKALKKLEALVAKVHNIIGGRSGVKLLDAAELEKIDLSAIREIFLRENADLVSDLTKKHQLVLSSFLQVFSTSLKRVELCLKRKGLPDLEDCTKNLQECQEYLKVVSDACLSALENVADLSSEVKNSFDEQKDAQFLDETVSSPVTNNEILMPSPHLHIDTNPYNGSSHDLQNRLALTPIQDTHKKLFSRYAPQCQAHQDVSVRLRPNLLLSRLNHHDTLLSSPDSSQHSRSRRFSPKKLHCPKTAGRYTRLFSNQMNRSNKSAGNDRMTSMVCGSKANSTAIANAIGGMSDISKMSLDMSVKSLCDISSDLRMEEKSARTDDEKAQNHGANAILSVPEIREMAEIEVITTKDTCTIQQSKQKRRSIGDLVERYKNLVELSKRNQSPRITDIPQEDELLE